MDTDEATVNSQFCEIDSWKRSKLTQEVYCKQNFLDYHDFTKYRALYLKERRNLKRETLGDFAEVTICDDIDAKPATISMEDSSSDKTRNSPDVIAILPNGIKLSVPPSFDRLHLLNMIDVLGAYRDTE